MKTKGMNVGFNHKKIIKYCSNYISYLKLELIKNEQKKKSQLTSFNFCVHFWNLYKKKFWFSFFRRKGRTSSNCSMRKNGTCVIKVNFFVCKTFYFPVTLFLALLLDVSISFLFFMEKCSVQSFSSCWQSQDIIHCKIDMIWIVWNEV